ncbi:MAG: hypothetical protein IID15_07240 [Candidatus Marinimicrobia bacterium]|nr:hypothetical protein [Candidatus Neomarinimicrobiota bacterium]
MLASPGLYALYGKGAKPASTNAPGETACQASKCHAQHPLNSGSGSLTLTGVPDQFISGKAYSLSITLEQKDQKRWGFQITALTPDSLAAGHFTITDELQTQLREEVMPEGYKRLYVEHTLIGSQMGVKDGPVSWTVDWVAPDNITGPVYFYLAANAANFNKKPWGDYIYTLTDTTRAAQP